MTARCTRSDRILMGWGGSVKSDRKFKTIYWGEDSSTEVIFEPITKLPPVELVSSCFVFALHDRDRAIMAKPKRGWGLPGGHREGDETAEECVRREAWEEAAVALGELTLVGRWSAKKLFASPHNEKYPDHAYQLLYVANVKELGEFTPEFEVSERALVPISQIKDYHHNFEDFREILDHILGTRP